MKFYRFLLVLVFFVKCGSAEKNIVSEHDPYTGEFAFVGVNQGIRGSYQLDITRNFAGSLYKLHMACSIMNSFIDVIPKSMGQERYRPRLPKRSPAATMMKRKRIFEQCKKTIEDVNRSFIWYDPNSQDSPHSPFLASWKLLKKRVPKRFRRHAAFKYMAKALLHNGVKIGRSQIKVGKMYKPIKSAAGQLSKGLTLEVGKYYMKKRLDKYHSKKNGNQKNEENSFEFDSLNKTKIGDAIPGPYYYDTRSDVNDLQDHYVSVATMRNDIAFMSDPVSRMWSHTDVLDVYVQNLILEVENIEEIVVCSLNGELNPLLFSTSELNAAFANITALAKKDGMILDVNSPLAVRKQFFKF